MAIGPVELNGMISRTQDYTTIKHNENQKVVVDQSNFQQRFEKEVDNKMNQVIKKDNADQTDNKFDAREKGSNQYSGNGGKNKKDKKPENEGKVVLKSANRFDIQV